MDDKKKNSMLEMFSKRAESSGQIRLRSVDYRNDGNSRNSRAQLNSKKIEEHADESEENAVPKQESIYEDIPFFMTADKKSACMDSCCINLEEFIILKSS